MKFPHFSKRRQLSLKVAERQEQRKKDIAKLTQELIVDGQVRKMN